MKKEYFAPEVDIVTFDDKVCNDFTLSSPIDDGGLDEEILQ